MNTSIPQADSVYLDRNGNILIFPPQNTHQRISYAQLNNWGIEVYRMSPERWDDHEREHWHEPLTRIMSYTDLVTMLEACLTPLAPQEKPDDENPSDEPALADFMKPFTMKGRLVCVPYHGDSEKETEKEPNGEESMKEDMTTLADTTYKYKSIVFQQELIQYGCVSDVPHPEIRIDITSIFKRARNMEEELKELKKAPYNISYDHTAVATALYDALTPYRYDGQFIIPFAKLEDAAKNFSLMLPDL